MSRDGIVFYASFYEAVKGLDDKSFKECVTALMEYGLYGNEIEMSGIAKMFFTMAKPQVDANNKRFENGKKGGRPKGTNKEPNGNQAETKEKPSENQTITITEPKDKEKVKVKDKEKEKVKEKKEISDLISGYTQNPELQKTIINFISMRKAIKKPLTENGLQLMLKRLNTIGSNDREKIEILNNSIMSNWQGIFPLKNNQRQEYLREGYNANPIRNEPLIPATAEEVKKAQDALSRMRGN